MGNVTMKWKKLVIVGVILCLFAVLAAFSAEDVHAANLAAGTSGTVKWTISAGNMHQNVDYTPFEGLEVSGRPREVFVNGVCASKDGEPTEALPGAYVAR